MGVVGWNANGPELVVELGVATSFGVDAIWDVSAWDEITWGFDVVWTDISQYVREMQINRGKDRSTEQFRYSVGTMSAVLSNADDRFSPINLAGPYVAGEVSQIKPRVPIRVYAYLSSDGGVTRDVNVSLFYGFVDLWQDQFPGQVDATTYVECSDVLSVLARFNGPERAPVGAGETLGARIIRIATNAGFTGNVFAEAGSVTLQATTLADNALTEATLSADTEGGSIYGGTDGSIRVQSSDGLTGRLSNAAFCTFGGSGIPISDPQFSWDADLLFNRVSFARVGGTQQTVTDVGSRAQYGDLAYSRFDLLAETDAAALQQASVVLARFLAPEYRVSAATVYPMRDMVVPTSFGELVDDSMWYHTLARELLDPVAAEAVTPGGLAVSSAAYIDGITHSIRNREWVTQFTFGSAEVYQAFATSVWDLGAWDESKWVF